MTTAIVGAGLIGTSIALAVQRRDPGARVITLDRGDAIEQVAGASLVVLATPVDAILDLLHHHARVFGDALVTDVGSTKRAVVAAAAGAGLATFVGGHPMAGAAATGPGAARADLFDGCAWFLVPNGAPPAVLAGARAFVEGLGARAVVFDDDGAEHDRLMAAVSHLPQVAAIALMKVVGDAAGVDNLRWAGPGCRDTTRLAASAASVWESVLATNAHEVRPLLLALADELRAAALTIDDPAGVRPLFEAANAYRRLLD